MLCHFLEAVLLSSSYPPFSPLFSNNSFLSSKQNHAPSHGLHSYLLSQVMNVPAAPGYGRPGRYTWSPSTPDLTPTPTRSSTTTLGDTPWKATPYPQGLP